MKLTYFLVFLNFILPNIGFSEQNCKQIFELKEARPDPIILLKETKEARPGPILRIKSAESVEELYLWPRSGPILLVDSP